MVTLIFAKKNIFELINILFKDMAQDQNDLIMEDSDSDEEELKEEEQQPQDELEKEEEEDGEEGDEMLEDYNNTDLSSYI